MKHLTLSVVAFILLAVVGCTFTFRHSNYNHGFNFPSENVKKIRNGKTTANELMQMFGGPLTKFDVSENEEVWNYSYSAGIQIVEKGFLTDTAQATGQHKSLNIVLKNGTVTDFSYTENSIPLDSSEAR